MQGKCRQLQFVVLVVALQSDTSFYTTMTYRAVQGLKCIVHVSLYCSRAAVRGCSNQHLFHMPRKQNIFHDVAILSPPEEL